ncbi:hypothetical protein DPMN_131020 [Dreissena polymorpha]|uniref:Uncharacterized protein n=1 Tax=Dreissena polymorpha TaxID=45954 RepID=A0A9D4H660_DREPO|nr:hypothetical protein DPMN_131020 [Dreissena polymorpha]
MKLMKTPCSVRKYYNFKLFKCDNQWYKYNPKNSYDGNPRDAQAWRNGYGVCLATRSSRVRSLPPERSLDFHKDIKYWI